MTILIGTDEAGYGPNFGPLLISATAWQIPDDDNAIDLYRVLRKVVRADTSSEKHVPIADSKALYKPGGGWANLERGLLSCSACAGQTVTTWREAWATFARHEAGYLDEVPWYDGYDSALPADLDVSDLQRCAERLASGLSEASVSLLHLRSTAVFPARFNKLLDEHDSKGVALSHETLQLVKAVLEETAGERVIIQCDKHGGRNKYGALLQTIFPDYLAEIVRESRETSIYRWGPASRRIQIRFTAKGESFLPTALASMASKYLRELAMKAFNAFWATHVPDLKPTAGYPVDAKRFKADIEATQQQLGIEDRILWRRK
ncbi:MAG: hypothetical protein CMJ64_27665 [Planctomycetaceae bacterium]|nr:hypothetical protein [Planctomycetaceae bacterium]